MSKYRREIDKTVSVDYLMVIDHVPGRKADTLGQEVEHCNDSGNIELNVNRSFGGGEDLVSINGCLEQRTIWISMSRSRARRLAMALLSAVDDWELLPHETHSEKRVYKVVA